MPKLPLPHEYAITFSISLSSPSLYIHFSLCVTEPALKASSLASTYIITYLLLLLPCRPLLHYLTLPMLQPLLSASLNCHPVPRTVRGRKGREGRAGEARSILAIGLAHPHPHTRTYTHTLAPYNTRPAAQHSADEIQRH